MSDGNLNPKERGLGRGLNALFEDDEQNFDSGASNDESGDVSRETGLPSAGAPSAGQTRLSLDQLKPGRFQPRQSFDDKALGQLAESIKTHGILQPLLVQKLDDGSYEIVAGERRWRAAQKAQLHDVPVIVTTLDDTQTLEIALIENLQREDLNPIEEAFGYKKLLEEFDKTQEELAGSLGKSRSHIANTIRLLGLPEKVQAYVRDGALSAGHARALVTSSDAEELAEDIVRRGLSVRATEQLVAEVSGRPAPEKKKKTGKPSPHTSSAAPEEKDVNILLLEEELTLALGMRVTVDARGTEGSLKIDFKSLDQLDDLLSRLSRPSSTPRRLMD